MSEAKRQEDEEKAAGEAVTKMAMEGLRISDDFSDELSTSANSSSHSGPTPDLNTLPPLQCRKRRGDEDILDFLKRREKQRREERQEELSLRRKELELRESRLEEDMRTMRSRRAMEEAAIEERRVL